MSLTAEEILRSEDIPKPTKVSVPEWGGDDAHVYIKVMGGDDRDSYEASQLERVDGKYVFVSHNPTAELLVRTLCDKDGKPLFNRAQVMALAKKNALVQERLFDIAADLNRLNKDAVKDTEKNLPAAQSGNSG